MEILNIHDAKSFAHNMRSGWDNAKEGTADIKHLHWISTPWTHENAITYAGFVAGVFAFQTGCSRPTLGELVDISPGATHFKKLAYAHAAGKKYEQEGGRGIEAKACKLYPQPERGPERRAFANGAWGD